VEKIAALFTRILDAPELGIDSRNKRGRRICDISTAHVRPRDFIRHGISAHRILVRDHGMASAPAKARPPGRHR